MFSRKTLALISSLVIVLVALFILSFSAPKSQVTTQTIQPTPTPVAQTVIKLSPNPVTLTDNTDGSVDVTMDTRGNEVSGLQLELLYDPKALTNVTIKQGTFFSNPAPLLLNINQKAGRISYLLSIAPAQPPLKGAGTVATIQFTKNPASELTQTEIKLLPATLVASPGVGPSVLKEATGATVTFAGSTTQ